MLREEFSVPAVGGQLSGWVSGSGEPVLCLHGGPGLSYDYLDPMVEELAAGYRVATYQQRGLPPSALEGPFSVLQEVADACAVLDGLGWDRAWVAGHSWGGHLVLHLAVERPDRLLGGLAVDPLGAVGDGGVAAMGARFGEWMAAQPRSTLDLPPEEDGDEDDPGPMVAESLGRIWPAYFAQPEHAPSMPLIWTRRAAYRGIFETIRERMPSLASRLAESEVTVGFVAGQRSPLAPDASTLPTAAAMRNAFVDLVPGAGHFPWHEVPGCVLAAMDRLTDRNLSTSGNEAINDQM